MINVEQLSYINLIRLTKEKGCEIEFPTTKYMKEFLTQLNNTYQYVISKPHCTNKITQLQNWWRRTRPQFDGLRISMNTVDPFSMIDICDIPKNYRITLYERQNKVIYTFDIRYLYIQMNNEGSLTNPFTQTKFNDISIKRVNDKVQWLKKHDIDVQLDDELLTDDQLLVRRYEQIVCKINRLGYTHVNLDWLCGIPGYRARIRPIVSRITIHWPSFYNVVTGKTLALPNLIALQHIPLSPAGVIAKRPAPIALPNSCAAEWRMAPDAVFSPYASVRYFTPHMVHSQYNLL